MSVAALLAGVAGAVGAVGVVDGTLAVATARAARPVRAHQGSAPGWAGALARLGRRIGAPAPPGDLAARLAAAGLSPALRTSDVMAAKAGAGVASALVAAPLAGALPMRMAVLVLPGSALAGFVAPDRWLHRRRRRRVARAELELADVLDLLRVAVEAGLPTGRALAEVGRRRGGLVAVELQRVAAQLALGVPRAVALEHLERRLPLPAIATLVAAVGRADRHGAPLGPALAALVHDARAQRARRLHDRAAAAAPRIQLAVALLLVPAVLLFVAAGLVHGLR